MEEGYPRIPTKTITKIFRTSVHRFLQNYQHYTTTAATLVFPFSVSILLSQVLLTPSSPLQNSIHSFINPVFEALGLPFSSDFFTILGLNLPHTIASSLIILPFSFTFLLFSKAYVIQSFNQIKPISSCFLPLFIPLFITQIWNSLLIFSANTTSFCLISLVFKCTDLFGFESPANSSLFLSACGALFYSVILANALVICNSALTLSGVENNCRGFIAIIKSCILIRGRTATAISLAVPLNIVLAAVEVLFHFRVVRAYNNHGQKSFNPSIALEGLFIAYLYSILIVLDTIVGCVFFNCCKIAYTVDQEDRFITSWKFRKDSCDFASVNIIEEV